MKVILSKFICNSVVYLYGGSPSSSFFAQLPRQAVCNSVQHIIDEDTAGLKPDLYTHISECEISGDYRISGCVGYGCLREGINFVSNGGVEVSFADCLDEISTMFK